MRSGRTFSNLFAAADETNLVQALVNAVERLHGAAAEVRLDVSCDASTTVAGSPTEWESALCDLLENAVTETCAGGSVHVQVHRTDEGVTIRIADEGPGVRADEFARYYERPALNGVRSLLQEWGGGKIAISSGGARAGTRVEVTVDEIESETPRPEALLA